MKSVKCVLEYQNSSKSFIKKAFQIVVGVLYISLQICQFVTHLTAYAKVSHLIYEYKEEIGVSLSPFLEAWDIDFFKWIAKND